MTNVNLDVLYEDIDLHDWEEMLAFFSGKSVEEATKSCKQEVLKQINNGEELHPGCAYADNLCAAIESHINRKYPSIKVEWFINCLETSLNLSCDGQIEKIADINDYLDFLNALTGFEDMYNILEAAHDYDLADATEAETKWINSSETLKLIRSTGVDEVIDQFASMDEDQIDTLLTECGCDYIIDDYPQRALATALVVKKIIDELTEGSITKLSCSDSKLAFIIDVKLKNGSQHHITCFDDMSELMTESVAL